MKSFVTKKFLAALPDASFVAFILQIAEIPRPTWQFAICFAKFEKVF
jgi:hypothetical protein